MKINALLCTMQDCATNTTDVQKHSVLLTWIAPCEATDVSFWYDPTTLHHLVNRGILSLCMNCNTSTSNTVGIFVTSLTFRLCTGSVCEKVGVKRFQVCKWHMHTIMNMSSIAPGHPQHL